MCWIVFVKVPVHMQRADVGCGVNRRGPCRRRHPGPRAADHVRLANWRRRRLRGTKDNKVH